MIKMSDDVCIICQEQGTLQNYIIENKNCKCKYYYHELCFPPSRRKKCPMCAKEITQSLQQEHNQVEIRIIPTAPLAVQPNQIPLLNSQPPPVQRLTVTPPAPRIQIQKQKIPGCICASIILIALITVMIIIIEHGK